MNKLNFLCNAFSLNMLSSLTATIVVEELDAQRVRGYLLDFPEAVSAVGHADTAAVFAEVLKHPVMTNRATVVLEPGDAIVVGQYSGPRLPEGATTLPEGATIKWALVTVIR